MNLDERQLKRLMALAEQVDYLMRLQTPAMGSAWDGEHLVLGAYHLWVDATGDLRIKSSAPTSDGDGTVVGTQT